MRATTELIRESGLASIKRLSVGSKVITTPSYSAEIRNWNDLRIIERAKPNHRLDNVGVVSVSVLDAKTILGQQARTLMMFTGTERENKIRSDSIILIDPSMEYFSHNVESERERFLTFDNLPSFLRNSLYQDRISESDLSNEELSMKCMEWSMNQQMKYGADLPLPPCFSITGMKSLARALEMNRRSQTYAKDNGWSRCAYFNIDSMKIFQSEECVSSMITALNVWEADVIVLKFRGGLMPKEPIEMANYFTFFSKLNELDSRKTVILLNTDSFGYINLGLGVDIFSEPMNGLIDKDVRPRPSRDGIRDPYPTYGKYLNPLDLRWWKFSQLRSLFINNGNRLPCNCPICRSINPRFLAISPNDWNIPRREHCPICRNEQISELLVNIHDSNVKGAMFAKLASNEMSSSPLNIYKCWFS